MITQKTTRRRHDANVAYRDKLDAQLPENRKVWVYGKCMKEVANRLRGKGVYPFDADEIASTIYYDLMDRRVGDVFPRGMPESDAVWMAFLKKEAEYAFMRYYRPSWRHPTESLDMPVSHGGADEDGDESEATLLDMIPDDTEDKYDSRPEVKIELENVRTAVSLICKRRNYKPTTCRIVESSFLDGESVADVAAKYDVAANNVSVIRFRFLDALRQDGSSTLAELEQFFRASA